MQVSHAAAVTGGTAYQKRQKHQEFVSEHRFLVGEAFGPTIVSTLRISYLSNGQHFDWKRGVD